MCEKKNSTVNKTSFSDTSKRRFLSIVRHGNYALAEAILSSPDGNINVAKRRPKKISGGGDAGDLKSAGSQSAGTTNAPPSDATGDVIMALVGDERCVFRHSVFHEYFHAAVMSKSRRSSELKGPLCTAFDGAEATIASKDLSLYRHNLVFKKPESSVESQLLSFDLRDYKYQATESKFTEAQAKRRGKFMSFIRLIRLMVELAIGSGCDECQRALIKSRQLSAGFLGKNFIVESDVALACALAMEPQRETGISMYGQRYTYKPIRELRLVKPVVELCTARIFHASSQFRAKVLFASSLETSCSPELLESQLRTLSIALGMPDRCELLFSTLESIFEAEESTAQIRTVCTKDRSQTSRTRGDIDSCDHIRSLSAGLINKSLELAIRWGKHSFASRLLAFGADVNALCIKDPFMPFRDQSKELSLTGVSSSSVLAMLLDCGADGAMTVSSSGKRIARPQLNLAGCAFGNASLGTLLSEGFFDPFYCDEGTHETALHVATSRNLKQNRVVILDACGVLAASDSTLSWKGNKIGGDGNPLYCRILDEQLAYARGTANVTGEAPLALVETDGCTSRCVCRLCRSIFARDKKGITPFRIALDNGRLDIVALFEQTVSLWVMRRNIKNAKRHGNGQ